MIYNPIFSTGSVFRKALFFFINRQKNTKEKPANGLNATENENELKVHFKE